MNDILKKRFENMSRNDITFGDRKEFRSFYEALPKTEQNRLDFMRVAFHVASILCHEEVYQDDILIHVITGDFDKIGS